MASFARSLVLLAAAAALSPCAFGGDDEDKPAPPPPPPYPSEEVTFPTSDGMRISATYGPSLSAPGAPAVVLVHNEGQTRATFDVLLPRLYQHRVPWLAIDLRGFGKSAVQNGVDRTADAFAKDPALYAGAAEDVVGAVKWLVEVRKHDPKRIGLLGAGGLGCAAATKALRTHPDLAAALLVMTPVVDVPGYDVVDDAQNLPGAPDYELLAGVDDMNRLEKKGPRHLLKVVQYSRDAPKDTPLMERIKRRRGIPPWIYAFAEEGTFGTAAFARVLHLDAWVAAWWARRFGTYPHPVLYDGYVDLKLDHADPEWLEGKIVPTAGGTIVRVLRWGRRLMVGGETPDDAKRIFLRTHAARGRNVETGQFADIAVPSGFVNASPLEHMGLRSASIDTTALVLEADPNPIDPNHPIVPHPSFEAEVSLPDLPADGEYVVQVSVGFDRAGGGGVDAPGVDPSKPETWFKVPDLGAPADPPPPPEAPPRFRR